MREMKLDKRGVFLRYRPYISSNHVLPKSSSSFLGPSFRLAFVRVSAVTQVVYPLSPLPDLHIYLADLALGSPILFADPFISSKPGPPLHRDVIFFF